MRPYWLAASMLLPTIALAAPAADYARQWPLTLSRADAGAYRVEFNADVHRQLASPQGDDFAVLDADGRTVPSMRLPPDAPDATDERRRVPFFALPLDRPREAGWTLDAQTDAQGRLQHVQVRGADGQPLQQAQATLLLDTSTLDAPVSSLEFDWTPAGALDQRFEVEASNDLQDWRAVASRGRLLDLPGADARLVRNRLVFDTPIRARYLRLLPTTTAPVLGLTRVDALVRCTRAAPLQWLELSPQTVAGAFEYRLEGRWPVTQADVRVDGNSAQHWRLSTRDTASAAWRPLADWDAFRVQAEGTARQSPPQVLGGVVRQSQWRLEGPGYSGPAPTLRLGYRPQALVFVAQGRPPYRLVAGSARLHQADAALGPVLDTMRAQQGPAWRPAMASVGEGAALAGSSALAPQRDWKAWMLWGVLALGAAIVAAFSISLLRKPR